MPKPSTFDFSKTLKRATENVTRWNTIVSRYLTPAMMEDIKLIMGDKVKLQNLLNRHTLFEEGSEWHTRKKLLVNGTSKEQTTEPAYYCGSDTANVLFINGVMTPLVIAVHQQQQLSQLIQQEVGLLYNPTKHLIADLLECHLDRNQLTSAVMQRCKTHILEVLERGPERLLIIGYSQGAIIASAALTELQQQCSPQTLSKIHYVTFGAGFKESAICPDILQEHFVNRHDPVPYLGLLHPDYRTTGRVFERDSWGHLLVADYINPMKQRGFGTGSEFVRRYLA